MPVDPDWFAVAPALIAERSDLDEMYQLIEKSLVEALDLLCKKGNAVAMGAASVAATPEGNAIRNK